MIHFLQSKIRNISLVLVFFSLKLALLNLKSSRLFIRVLSSIIEYILVPIFYNQKYYTFWSYKKSLNLSKIDFLIYRFYSTKKEYL